MRTSAGTRKEERKGGASPSRDVIPHFCIQASTYRSTRIKNPIAKTTGRGALFFRLQLNIWHIKYLVSSNHLQRQQLLRCAGATRFRLSVTWCDAAIAVEDAISDIRKNYLALISDAPNSDLGSRYSQSCPAELPPHRQIYAAGASYRTDRNCHLTTSGSSHHSEAVLLGVSAAMRNQKSL
jgi:hypothetical protein